MDPLLVWNLYVQAVLVTTFSSKFVCSLPELVWV